MWVMMHIPLLAILIREHSTVATFQSLSQDQRLAKYPNETLKGIIIDEAHHASAPR